VKLKDVMDAADDLPPMPPSLKKAIEKAGLDWTGRKFKLKQKGRRFSVNFSDWKDLTLDELSICCWGGLVDEWPKVPRVEKQYALAMRGSGKA